MNPLALFTTARKALAAALAIAVSVEATGVFTGNYDRWLTQGIAVATAVLGGTLTYAVGNYPSKAQLASVAQEEADAQQALLAQFTSGSPVGTATAPPVPAPAAQSGTATA